MGRGAGEREREGVRKQEREGEREREGWREGERRGEREGGGENHEPVYKTSTSDFVSLNALYIIIQERLS